MSLAAGGLTFLFAPHCGKLFLTRLNWVWSNGRGVCTQIHFDRNFQN